MANVKPKSNEPDDDASGTVAVEAPEDMAAKKKDPTEVRYVGQATTRRITPAEWLKAGVPDEPMLVMARNETVPLDRFSKSALEVMHRDGNFKFE